MIGHQFLSDKQLNLYLFPIVFVVVRSLTSSKLPDSWKKGNVITIFKKGFHAELHSELPSHNLNFNYQQNACLNLLLEILH